MHDADINICPDPNVEESRNTPIHTLRRFNDDSAAEAWLVAQRWPDGVRCPKCDSDNIAEPPDRRPMPYRCRKCRTQFSVKSHSAMRASKHSLTTWVQAFHICSAVSNPDAVDIRDLLPVTNKAAWNLALRIHEAWELRESYLPDGTQRRLI